MIQTWIGCAGIRTAATGVVGSRRLGRRWTCVVAIAVLAAPVLLAGCLCGAVTAAPVAAATKGPGAPQPIVVGIASVTLNEGVDLRGDHPTYAGGSCSILLTAPLPDDRILLEIASSHFDPVISNAGERLAFIGGPMRRTPGITLLPQGRSEHLVRLNFVLTPPWTPCSSIHGIQGRMGLRLGVGPVRTIELSLDRLLPGLVQDMPGIPQGTLSVALREDRRLVLKLTPSLVAAFAGATVRNAAGVETPMGPGRALPETGRYQFVLPAIAHGTLVISYAAAVEDRDVVVSIPVIDIPGGLPGIGTMLPPDPPNRPNMAGYRTLRFPLSRAIARADLAALAAGIAAGDDLEAPDRDGLRPLERAAGMGFLGGMTLLLDTGAAVDGRTRSGLTALSLAAEAGQAGAVRMLLARGANPAVIAANGWSALDAAVSGGASMDIIDMLLAHGLDPFTVNSGGFDALQLAFNHRRWRILHHLLGNADIPPAPGVAPTARAQTLP